MNMVHFKIVSLNVNGLRLAPKRKALFNSLRDMQADFIFLQEVHSQPSDVPVWLSEWGGKGVFAHGRTSSCGVCILFKPSVSHTILDLDMDPAGRFVLLQIKHESTRGTFHRKQYSARLDYFFVSEYLLPDITSVDIQPEPFSDHCVIALDMVINTRARGPGFWRFNNTLLSDPDFLKEMRDHLIDSQHEDLDNPNTQWEWLKYKARSFSIAFGIRKARMERALEMDLQRRLKKLGTDHDLSDSPEVVSEVESIKRELSEILQNKANKAIFRAKVNWAQYGEKPTAYFLGLEKRNSKQNTITSLVDEHCRNITANQDILAFEKNYFEKIYREDPTQLRNIDDFTVPNTTIPQVADHHRTLVDLPFTKRDFHQALKDLNKNKSPGSDGLSPEFYLSFWDIMEDQFYNSIMFSLENNKMSEEQRTGIITLVPKKAKDRTNLANWRPITLLNVDFKIYSKALANKIQMCIKDVVQADQTGFVRGRTITTNLINVQAVIDQVNISQTTGLLLAIDYAKAFDTIRWSLIYKALEVFGFGEFISTAVTLLFQDIKTRVYNAGHSSAFFYPNRGIRQGCCCSPSLFILAVELLAILVRESPDIEGIKLGTRHLSISQYADDTTFFVRNTTSLEALMQLIDFFTEFSGLKLNRQKSYILLLGNCLHPPSHLHDIKVTEQVSILGIFFKNSMTDDAHFQLNFQHKLQKIEDICNTWLNRNISLKGKVVLVNSLLISILHYPCSCTFVPQRVYRQFKKIITDFLWKGGRSKIAYDVLIQDISDGGLKLQDLETRVKTIHVKWIQHMWLNPTSTLAEVLQESTAAGNSNLLILGKMNITHFLPQRQVFLKQVLKTWAALHTFDPKDEEEIQKETLWFNSFILVNRRPIFWQSWSAAGIRTINDLLHPTEPRFLSHLEVSQTYGCSASFCEILQIRSSIPFIWRRKLLNHAKEDIVINPSIFTFEDSSLQIHNLTSKRIYLSIVKMRKPLIISSQKKWNETFPIGEEDLHNKWKEIYKSPYQVARDTKLQAFQYRVIHRTIPCNRFLKNIRILPTDVCSFCQQSDTIQHFLVQCLPTKTFWNNISEWLDREAGIQFNMSLRARLFGVPTSHPRAKVVNFLSIFVKFYIYRQKLFHEGSLSTLQLLRELRLRL